MTASTEGRITTRFVSEGSDELARDAREAAQALEGVGGEAREASGSLEQYESSARGAAESSSGLSDAARESTQQTALLQQRLSALAGGLSGIGSILGTESELGSVVGRMGQFASTGLQLGMVFGPTGAVVGGILGAAVPALEGLADALSPTVPLIESVGNTAQRTGDQMIALGQSFDGAGDRMRAFVASLSSAGQGRELEDLNARIAETADRIAYLRSGGGTAIDRLEIPALAEQFESLSARSADLRSQIDEARSPRRGGGRRQPADDGAREAQREKERQAELAFAETLARLEAERLDAEEAAARRRAEERRDSEKAAQDAWDAAVRRDEEASRLRERQQREEADRVDRANRLRQRQTQAWRDLSGEMLGTTLEGANAIGGAFAGAFEQAITGQESFDAAFAKGAKSALIQFGTAQVAEGIGALLTAAGNVILNPPAAATKAVEGAGKIALGVSLGAAGAAISVPSSGATDTQSDRAPRLGPADQGSAESRAVVVNLNAPSIVAGTRAQLGREMGRAISDGTRRFGRAAA
jgi:hypothetical protein